MKTQEEIQRAHDILHAAVMNEIPIQMASISRAACHAAHDALAWVLDFPCGQGLDTNLSRIECEAARLGHELREEET